MGASYTYAAGAVLIAVPVAILYLSLQKYFVSGLTAGGTKRLITQDLNDEIKKQFVSGGHAGHWIDHDGPLGSGG